MKSTKLWTIAAAAALLVACGGGGGDDAPASEPPPAPIKAEGAYEGTMSSGYTFNALILENDEFWTLYGQSTGGTLYVLGMVQGSGSTSGNHFVSSNAKDFYYNGIVAPGSLSATFVPRTSFNGTASAGGQSVSFNAAGIPSADFNYDQPASLAAVAGSWSGATLEGGVGTLNISAAGAISGCATREGASHDC